MEKESSHSKEQAVPNVSTRPKLVNRHKSQASIETDIDRNDEVHRKSSKISEVHKIIHGLQLNVKDMAQNLKNQNEKDEDDEFEESVEQEQEEWQSVARAVDSLFFRLYLFIVFTTYIGLIGVAINGTFSLEHQLD